MKMWWWNIMLNKRIKKYILLLISTIVITGLGYFGYTSYYSPTVEPGNIDPTTVELSFIETLEVPEYSGNPYVTINNGIPFFDTENLDTDAYEIYYPLDELGRVVMAEAVLGQETMATGKRQSISEVKPTGWHSDRYDFVNGQALYNRCHLIAHYLSDENANPNNLVTGTRYMNEDGMNDIENMIGDYMKETGNHVRYRVTPKWTEDNLICDGLLIEAWSIEDAGEDICLNIFAYNVQPGVYIDYKTGDNYALDGGNKISYTPKQENPKYLDEDIEGEYVLHIKKMKFHYPDCTGALSMSENNKQVYYGSRNQLITDGYSPCGECNP